MIKRCLLFWIILVTSSLAVDEISITPDYTLLWNRFVEIKTIDEYVMGLGDDGLAALRYDAMTGYFDAVDYILLDDEPAKMKLFDNILAVRSVGDNLYFIDVSNLPDIELLGSVNPGVSYDDYVMHGDDIYISRWYDGLFRFSLEDYNTISMVDYSLTGALITQLEIKNDELFVLDEYNGIMRYNVADTGFGRLQDYLYVPDRISSFCMEDTLTFILLEDEDVLIAEYNEIGGIVVDSINTVQNPRKFFVVDSIYVVVGYRTIDLINCNDYDIRSAALLEECNFEGDIYNFLSETVLLFPGLYSGLAFYSVNSFEEPIRALARPGPIHDLLFIENRLISGGMDNPIDVYSVNTGQIPVLEYTIYDEIDHIKAMDRNGDTLFALLSEQDRIVVIIKADDTDSCFLENSIFVDAGSINDIIFAGTIHEPFQSLVAVKDYELDIYNFSDSASIELVATWDFSETINELSTHNDLFYISLGNNFYIYEADLSYNPALISETAFDGTAKEIVLNNEQVYLFDWDRMVHYDCSIPEQPELIASEILAFSVIDAVIKNGLLFTTGFDGNGIFDLVNVTPELIASGGQGGVMIAVNGDFLATSDNYAIHLYDINDYQTIPVFSESSSEFFVLSQNYPNPFNATTVIEYEIPNNSRVKVAVYNILGREVKSLVDEVKPAGLYAASWDGTAESGNVVASGIYLYRIEIGQTVETRKMMLIK